VVSSSSSSSSHRDPTPPPINVARLQKDISKQHNHEKKEKIKAAKARDERNIELE
jgi:hypothetical protein